VRAEGIGVYLLPGQKLTCFLEYASHGGPLGREFVSDILLEEM
jgi:hypothetical protein